MAGRKLRLLGLAFKKSVQAALQTFRQTLSETDPNSAEVQSALPTADLELRQLEVLPAPEKPLEIKTNQSEIETVEAPLPTPAMEVAPPPKERPFWEVDGFWAFLDSFLKVQNSAHTRRAYEADLVDFLSYLKATDKKMNVHTLIEYRETLKQRLSPRTGQPLSHVSINRRIATLKSFLNWLVVNGVLPNNPAKAVKSFRAGRESPTRDIPNDRVRQMLTLPARHKTAGRMHHAMLMVLFHLGLRRAELVGLRTSDLFEQDGMRVMRVRGKGDKERVLPIPPEVAKSIDTYLEFSKKNLSVDQPLFTPVKNNITKVKDKPLHPNAVAYVVKHYAKLAGVAYRVSPHSARATAVSNALDNAAPHRAVQHMAGWSSPLMVTRYDKRKEDLRNSAVKFVTYDETT